MTDTVIRVENLGKKYVIDHQQQERYSTLRDAIANRARSFAQKPLHYLAQRRAESPQEEFWALKNISFEIKQGDRVGIIGRNGAGKSTLLKILSRITEPTTGRICINGRVASLLEVGTGFHPELTGRENIYLNGAILGMSKVEIKRKFDEIVDFAEVEKFLDTPVKRYSSGMYVRLAFAVAAHLEPEILIVDEVLAVGDAQFQKKCLGKMEDVGKEGRTVIFVSHNMGMISRLCEKALILRNGKLLMEGHTKEAISTYMNEVVDNKSNFFVRSKQKMLDKDTYINRIETVDSFGVEKSEFGHTEPINLNIRCVAGKWIDNILIAVIAKNLSGQKIFTSQVPLNLLSQGQKKSNEFQIKMRVPTKLLTPGRYSFSIALHIPNVSILDQVDEAVTFSIFDTGSEFALFEGVDYGCVFADCTWEL